MVEENKARAAIDRYARRLLQSISRVDLASDRFVRHAPNCSLQVAEVAELADAHGSGPCTRKGVGVRVPPSAP